MSKGKYEKNHSNGKNGNYSNKTNNYDRNDRKSFNRDGRSKNFRKNFLGHSAKYRDKQSKNGKQSYDKNYKNNVTCYACDGKGHYSKEFPKKNNSSESANVLNESKNLRNGNPTATTSRSVYVKEIRKESLNCGFPDV